LVLEVGESAAEFVPGSADFIAVVEGAGLNFVPQVVMASYQVGDGLLDGGDGIACRSTDRHRRIDDPYTRDSQA
jgi:hypothetical protein